jgi:hypothetical protein
MKFNAGQGALFLMGHAFTVLDTSAAAIRPTINARTTEAGACNILRPAHVSVAKLSKSSSPSKETKMPATNHVGKHFAGVKVIKSALRTGLVGGPVACAALWLAQLFS